MRLLQGKSRSSHMLPCHSLGDYSTFIAGSKSLVLVHVELDLTNISRLKGHTRSQSDELLEDLENQLGSAECEYLKVNLVYRHSVFSSAIASSGGVTSNKGIINTDTKLCTAFTATIARYNAASPWSPPPAPTPNRLVGIIAAHWGMDAADNLLHSKLTPQRMTPRKTTYLSFPGDSRGRARNLQHQILEPLHDLTPNQSPPLSPGVASSRVQQQIRDENRRSVQYEDVDDGDASDPASRIWAKIRRYSGAGISLHRRNISTSTTASVAASINLPFSAAYGVGNSRAFRRQKHGINEGGSIMQRQLLAATGSKQSLTDRTNLSMADVSDAMDSSKLRSRKGSGKSRRSSGRWVFSNWWLNG